MEKQTVAQLLDKHGYKCYPQNRPGSVEYLYQKRVKSKSVCETNDRLYINVKEQTINIRNDEWTRYTVEIVAEKRKLWWSLNAYSLTAKELKKRLVYLEKTLVKLFNAIGV